MWEERGRGFLGRVSLFGEFFITKQAKLDRDALQTVVYCVDIFEHAAKKVPNRDYSGSS